MYILFFLILANAILLWAGRIPTHSAPQHCPFRVHPSLFSVVFHYFDLARGVEVGRFNRWRLPAESEPSQISALNKKSCGVWIPDNYLFLDVKWVFSVKSGMVVQSEDRFIYTLSWRRLGRSSSWEMLTSCLLWAVCLLLFAETCLR